MDGLFFSILFPTSRIKKDIYVHIGKLSTVTFLIFQIFFSITVLHKSVFYI